MPAAVAASVRATKNPSAQKRNRVLDVMAMGREKHHRLLTTVLKMIRG
jgi:hypothetical protein